MPDASRVLILDIRPSRTKQEHRFPFFLKCTLPPLSPLPPRASPYSPPGPTRRAHPLGQRHRQTSRCLRPLSGRLPERRGAAGGKAGGSRRLGVAAASAPRAPGGGDAPGFPHSARPGSAAPGPAPGGRRGEMDGWRFLRRHTPRSSNINEYGYGLGRGRRARVTKELCVKRM